MERERESAGNEQRRTDRDAEDGRACVTFRRAFKKMNVAMILTMLRGFFKSAKDFGYLSKNAFRNGQLFNVDKTAMLY